MNPLMQGMGMSNGVNPQAIQQVKRMMNMFRAASRRRGRKNLIDSSRQFDESSFPYAETDIGGGTE